MADMQITIDPRYCGPSSSGNGGWTAGLLAEAIGDASGSELGPVTVRLNAPPPLGRPLELRVDGAAASLTDGEVHVATARPAGGSWSREPVPYADTDAAAATADRYVRPDDHPFPRCFVCGTGRERGDGMRLTPGRLAGGGTACVWHPAEVLSGAHVAEPLVWAALDCPGGWASDLTGRPMVLGTMTAQVHRLPQASQACVVTGRVDRTDGRKTWTSTALYAGADRLLARAEALWFEVDAAAFNATRG